MVFSRWNINLQVSVTSWLESTLNLIPSASSRWSSTRSIASTLPSTNSSIHSIRTSLASVSSVGSTSSSTSFGSDTRTLCFRSSLIRMKCPRMGCHLPGCWSGLRGLMRLMTRCHQIQRRFTSLIMTMTRSRTACIWRLNIATKRHRCDLRELTSLRLLLVMNNTSKDAASPLMLRKPSRASKVWWINSTRLRSSTLTTACQLHTKRYPSFTWQAKLHLLTSRKPLWPC